MDTLKTLFGLLWKVIVLAQQTILTLFAFVILIGVIAFVNASKSDGVPVVPKSGALVLAPSGVIVEALTWRDRTDLLLMEENQPDRETALKDILTVIKRAKDDDRITGIVLLTDGMVGGGPSKLHAIAEALKDFKTSEKPIYAVSTAYSQADYLIASQADQIFMNSAGNVLLPGYGGNGAYFKSALDKLKVDVNVFRVGTYKSAVEPYIRDDMSKDAKEANLKFMNVLWDEYQATVADGRDLNSNSLTKDANNLIENLRAAEGNLAKMAQQRGLVDKLVSRNEWRAELVEKFGRMRGNDSFNQIHFKNYLAATNAETAGSDSDNQIAVITAQGNIVMGNAGNEVAAAETIVQQVRRARSRSSTKAIVLRVDSPGGSAFASELIRQELVAAQNQGIPVIASFSSVAASGGYWISATSDKIIAAPTTITGSIGIYGIIPTFERTLDAIGIHTDGVGTTKLAGAFDPTKSLSPIASELIQQSIDNGYAEFLNLVATGRGMSLGDVSRIAEGRVWSGKTALELGLVDELGDFETAVASAVELADIEDYELVFYQKAPDEFTKLLNAMFGQAAKASFDTPEMMQAYSPFMKLAMQLKLDAAFLANLNDPTGKYVVCMDCSVH